MELLLQRLLQRLLHYSIQSSCEFLSEHVIQNGFSWHYLVHDSSFYLQPCRIFCIHSMHLDVFFYLLSPHEKPTCHMPVKDYLFLQGRSRLSTRGFHTFYKCLISALHTIRFSIWTVRVAGRKEIFLVTSALPSPSSVAANGEGHCEVRFLLSYWK